MRRAISRRAFQIVLCAELWKRLFHMTAATAVIAQQQERTRYKRRVFHILSTLLHGEETLYNTQRSTLGNRAFPVTASRTWNSLPLHLSDCALSDPSTAEDIFYTNRASATTELT